MTQEQTDTELAFLRAQIAWSSLQSMDMKHKANMWESLRTSIESNPSLETAWTDFVMVLKLADADVAEQLDTIIKI